MKGLRCPLGQARREQARPGHLQQHKTVYVIIYFVLGPKWWSYEGTARAQSSPQFATSVPLAILKHVQAFRARLESDNKNSEIHLSSK
ncbi:hypothetical protein Mapa_009521 [Marchantia paleacea]|nr:hypothetical protein Mapa_009521 [Marchantia paleacea]